MPVYEYQCQACGHQFEASQRITEPRLSDCPKCNKPSLERLISATSFLLKGGGWYRDGYGDKKARTDNDRGDRLGKALDDDKKKTEAATATTTTTDGGGGGSDGGGSGGGGGSDGGGGGSSGSSGGGGSASDSKSAAA